MRTGPDCRLPASLGTQTSPVSCRPLLRGGGRRPATEAPEGGPLEERDTWLHPCHLLEVVGVGLTPESTPDTAVPETIPRTLDTHMRTCTQHMHTHVCTCTHAHAVHVRTHTKTCALAWGRGSLTQRTAPNPTRCAGLAIANPGRFRTSDARDAFQRQISEGHRPRLRGLGRGLQSTDCDRSDTETVEPWMQETAGGWAERDPQHPSGQRRAWLSTNIGQGKGRLSWAPPPHRALRTWSDSKAASPNQ